MAVKLGDPEDAPRLAAFTTRLIDEGKDAAAIAMWHGPVNGDLRTARRVRGSIGARNPSMASLWTGLPDD